MADPILDCSDIDQHLGKAITSSRIREPISNNDIRRWAHTMQNQKGTTVALGTVNIALPKRAS